MLTYALVFGVIPEILGRDYPGTAGMDVTFHWDVYSPNPGKEVDSMSSLRIEQEGKPAEELDFEQLSALSGQVDDVSSLIPGRVGGAVSLQAILDRVKPHQDLDYLTVESTDGGFSASVPLEALRGALVAYRLGNEPLPEDKGGPLRFLIPNDEGCATGGADACANVKFVGTLRFTKGPGKDTRPTTPRQHTDLHEREGKGRN